MKTLLCSLLIMLGVPAFGATVKYYDDYPLNTNPPSTFKLSIQTVDKSVGGVPYNYMTLGDFVDWLGVNGFTNGSGTIIVSNASFQFITNLYAYLTNIYSTNIITTNLFATFESITYATNQNITVTSNANFNNVYETNVTIVVPGGLTNLNATPKTVAWWDANDGIGSIPNASGVLTNDGSGGIGWSSTFSLTELDAQNAYLTNVFVFITNAPYLATDANGQVIAGTGTISNNTSIVNNFSATYITNNTSYITNLNYVTGKGNTLIITNVGIYGVQTNFNVAASSAVISKADQVLTNAPNAHGVFTNTASGPPSFGLLQPTEIATITGAPGTAALVTQPPILSFSSDSNSITMSTNINNTFFFVANKAVSLTNVTLSIAGQMTYADLVVSNSLATSITNYETIPGAKIFGVSSASTATNAIVIPAAKEAYWHVECRGINETNVFVCVQQ